MNTADVQQTTPVANYETKEIVTFQQDQDVNKVEKPFMSYSASLTRVFNDSHEHDIMTFIRTPVKLTTLLFSTTDNIGTPLFTFNMPADFYTNANLNMYRAKLNQLRFLRADIKFRFLVNASKADTGRYLASWDPFGQEAGLTNWISTLAYNTQLQHCEIVCGPGKSTELKIPFVSPFTAIDINITNWNYGVLRVIPMRALQSVTTGATARCDIYFSFENVKLSVRTPGTSPAAALPLTDPYTAAFPPSLIPENQSLIKEAMSTALQGVEGVANAGASLVPKVHKAMARAPWIEGAMAGVGSLMGLSKPTTNEAVMKVVNLPAFGLTNAIGVDQSVSLSTTPMNSTTVDSEIFSTTQDELDIRYLVSQKNYLSQFNWPGTAAPGSVLWANPVHPGLCPTEETTDATTFETTRLSFIGSMFEWWRGSISFRLSLIKNDFYSGRLLISFVSGLTVNAATVTNEAPRVRLIWDISETNDIVFTIPYKNYAPALRYCAYKEGVPSTNVDTVFSLGALLISVDTELVYPASVVRPDIDCLVYISGGPDIAFGTPDMVKFKPLYVLPEPMPLLPEGFDDTDEDGLVEFPRPENQSLVSEMTFDHNEQANYTDPELGHILLYEDPKYFDTTAPEYCWGEMITNLREVIKRFGLVTDTYTGTLINLDGGYFYNNDMNSTSNVPLYYVASFHRFGKGGRRWKIFVDERVEANDGTAPILDRATQRQLRAYSQLPISTAPAGLTGAIRPRGVSNFYHVVYTDLNPVLEITCPYVANTPMMVVTDATSLPQKARMTYAVEVFPRGTLWRTPSLQIWTAAAEDTDFGYAVGTRWIQQISG